MPPVGAEDTLLPPTLPTQLFAWTLLKGLDRERFRYVGKGGVDPPISPSHTRKQEVPGEVMGHLVSVYCASPVPQLGLSHCFLGASFSGRFRGPHKLNRADSSGFQLTAPLGTDRFPELQTQ